MTLYRLSLRSAMYVSLGFSFHGSQRTAIAAKMEAVRRSAENDEAVSAKESAVDGFDITPTKAGILAALNKLAGHPDNG